MDNIHRLEEPASGRTERIGAAARQELEEYALSISEAARQIGKGVSTTTLSKFLRGLYEGDSDAVAARIDTWLRTRAQSRAHGLDAAGLDRHVDLGVTEDIGAALVHAQAAGDLVLVHGRSGCGKSWTADRYCRTHAAAYLVQVTEAYTSIAGLLLQVSAAVGSGGMHRSALAAETAIIESLRGRTALLVVDEAHHLSPRLLDELRCIRDISRAGLALIGDDTLWSVLNASRRCDQIVGRIGVRLPLGAAAESDVMDLAASALRRDPSARERKQLLAAARGQGGLHALRRLLARAFVSARADLRDAITAADVALAADAAAA